MTSALLFVAILLILGVALRQGLPLFKWMYIPASVIGGFLGLIVIQACDADVGLGGKTAMSWAATQSDVLSGWPGWLIAVVFAGMLIDRKPAAAGEGALRVARQGIMVWVIVLGETAIGLLAVWLLIKGNYDVPNSLGMLIETGFAGGHGTAAAMGEVFAHRTVNLAGGKDLGMLMATFGLVFGIVSGILWINIGVRKGWLNADAVQSSKRQGASHRFSSGNESTANALTQPRGDEDESREPPVAHPRQSLGYARLSGDAIDPLLLQVLWLALAFGVGLLMQQIVMLVAGGIDHWINAPVVGDGVGSNSAGDSANRELAQRLTVSSVVDFPLFIYTLFGGLFVQKVLRAYGFEQLIDGITIGRLTATAMDILVVAAIASLNLSVVSALAVPFIILFACGAVWTAFCLLVLSRWLLPREYWFQLGLINYGMSTGTTATGFVLLKMVDPDLKSGAAEDYALAAPLSAPFIGGGIITIALPLVVLEKMSIAIPTLAVAFVVIVLILLGIKISALANNG